MQAKRITGRLLTGQALAAGHQVAAVTRQPDSFPLRHGRLEVIGADVLDPDGGFLFNRVLLPYVTRVLGKTLYDDMRRMETLIRASDLDWTIVRPSGLYHLPSVTDYTLVDGHVDGRFTTCVDLAASMLADDRYLRATAGVITTGDNPTLLQWIRRKQSPAIPEVADRKLPGGATTWFSLYIVTLEHLGCAPKGRGGCRTCWKFRWRAENRLSSR